jgi:hypothetical protein
MGAQSTTATVVGMVIKIGVLQVVFTLCLGYSTLKEKEKSTKLVPGLVVKGLG